MRKDRVRAEKHSRVPMRLSKVQKRCVPGNNRIAVEVGIRMERMLSALATAS